MKKYALLLMALVMATATWAQEKNLSALFGYSTFYIPGENQPYVETYLDFSAWTLNFEQLSADKYQATVEVTLLVTKNDTVAFVKKYDLKSPVTANDTDLYFTFFDLQRFSLPNGIYDLQLTMHDKLSDRQPVLYNDKLVVFYQENKPSMSNIQLMSSATPTKADNLLSRNGYDMMPYINDFVPASMKQLNPYVELYNLDKELGDSPYVVRAYVCRVETGNKLSSFETMIRRKAPKALEAIYLSVDISELPSGNYQLVVEVVGADNQAILKREMQFMRSNPNVQDDALADDLVASSFAALITDEQQMDYYLDALYPISSPTEIEQVKELLQMGTLVAKQTYFFNFWRARNFLDPAADWDYYKKQLDYVEAHFTYPRTPGYRSELGRVYLQYGPPDYIRDEKSFVSFLNISEGPNMPNNNTNGVFSSPTSADQERSTKSQGTVHYLPYQLWRYNHVRGDFGNRVFIFWDQYHSGYYKLLNSNAKGELQTPFWERVLCNNQLKENVVGEVGQQFERGY